MSFKEFIIVIIIIIIIIIIVKIIVIANDSIINIIHVATAFCATVL